MALDRRQEDRAADDLESSLSRLEVFLKSSLREVTQIRKQQQRDQPKED